LNTADEGPSEDWTDAATVRNSTEKRVAEAFDVLEGLSDQLPQTVDVRQSAADTYCKAFLSGVTDGRKTACVVAACVRLGPLETEQAIPSKRLIEIGEIPQQQYRLALRSLQQELDMSITTPTAVEYLSFLAAELELSEANQSTVRDLLDEVKDQQAFVGKDPRGTVGAAIYIVAAERTQSEIAEALGVSTETLRTRANLIQEYQ
jgi:transcription initiation factor TFIIIB Brf1 subunit/transcription initiation factor TFIIB